MNEMAFLMNEMAFLMNEMDFLMNDMVLIGHNLNSRLYWYGGVTVILPGYARLYGRIFELPCQNSPLGSVRTIKL